MYCQKCGTENLGDAQVCAGCGGVFVYSKTARTSGMAITSMILGISGFSMFGVFGVTWIIGLIFGIIALQKISKSGGRLKGKGWAITGIVTSGAGLALVLTILGVMMMFTSFKTISLSRKIIGCNSAAVKQAGPTVKGVVCIMEDKALPDSNCRTDLIGTLKTPEDVSKVTTSAGCGDVKASWKFVRAGQDGDVYDFTYTVPVNENATATGTIKVVYDGTEQVVYEGQKVKIFIAPVPIADDNDQKAQAESGS